MEWDYPITVTIPPETEEEEITVYFLVYLPQ
jgi:hypothetical protein